MDNIAQIIPIETFENKIFIFPTHCSSKSKADWNIFGFYLNLQRVLQRIMSNRGTNLAVSQLFA